METATQKKTKECKLCGVQYDEAEGHSAHVPYGERVRKVRQELEQSEKRVKMLEQKIKDAGIPELEAEIRALKQDRDSWEKNCIQAVENLGDLLEEKKQWQKERAELGTVIVFAEQFLTTLGININDALRQIQEKTP